MKFDTVIIGGGLAGLTCGIRLQQAGTKCAIVSAGQSALHFSSGSFDLLNELPDGTPVSNPEEAVAQLDKSHPYAKIGDRFTHYAQEAKQLLIASGVGVHGDSKHNTYRISPMGTTLPTWLTLDDFTTLESPDELKGKKILLVNITGFLDLDTKVVADAFEPAGASCQIVAISLPEFERLRQSPTEMRSANIARVMESGSVLETFIARLQEKSKGFDIVAVPAIFGLASSQTVSTLKKQLDTPVYVIPTMPPSVPGIRTQQRLRHVFEQAGGYYMLGDTVVNAETGDSRVYSVYTVNHGDIALQADHFVLASGSFFSNGLYALMDRVFDPVFDADVEFDPNRNTWYDPSVFASQRYRTFGVATDDRFRIKIHGKTQENVYAIGSVLSGFDALQEGCGAGVSLLTALYVADNLKK